MINSENSTIKQENIEKIQLSRVKNVFSKAHFEKSGSIWIKAIKKLYLENNFQFPDAYSTGSNPTVKDLKILGQEIYADIKGTDFKLYKIKIVFKKAENKVKEEIKNYISSHPSVALDVSIGHFSESFTELLEEKDLCIFPQNLDEITTTCTCGEKSFCPHLVSIYNSLEKEINKNPFILFNLIGINTSELTEAAKLTVGFSGNVKKNIQSKFKSIDEFKYEPEEGNFAYKSNPDFSFPVLDIESYFYLLPPDPMFFAKKDFKSKLINVYETVETKLDSILVNEKLAPVRNTEFYLYYSDKNELKAFITPTNSFLYYLKSKGSRLRYSTERLAVPIFDENEQKIVLQEKEGISIAADIVYDYFLYHSLSDDKENISPSSKFLTTTASLAVALVRALSFIPEVAMEDDENFSIKYIPLTEKAEVEDAINYHKSLMPENFAFKEKGNKILAQDAAYDILSIFLTHIIHKLTFLKTSKLKNDGVTNIFTKAQSFSAITSDGKNIASSITNWLNVVSEKNKDINPVLKINPIEESNEDEFAIYVDILNSKNNEIIPLFKLFEEKKEIFSSPANQIKSNVLRQIMSASNYMPLLKDILDSKGLVAPVIDLKEILEIISKTSVFLNALGIKVINPKGLKNLLTPRVLLKARMKNSKNIDINSLFDTDQKSAISFDELMNFSYEVAIGDEKISKEDFLELVKSADGIVKYKDQYILLNPDEINSILDRLNKPTPEISDSMELLHSTFSGFFNGIDFDAGDALKRAVDDFLKIDEINIPEGLHGTLRPYQERGFKWLYSNTLRGFGSCMADDMGLGKTIQVISLLLKLKEENKLNNPALVVCPTTLVGNWYKECARFAPSLNVHIYHGIDRTMEFDGIDVAITTYGLLRNDIEKFKEKEWDLVIIDEAQNIKNPDAAQTIAVKSVKTKTFIAMTGTPVENRLSELWSIFDFTNKGYLGNLRNFQQNYAAPIEKFRDADRIEKLRLATSPFVLRRLKNDKSIINDLPEKIVFDEYCYLTKEQAALYEKVLENSFKAMESKSGIDRKGHIFKLITSLKQICNHPAQYTKADSLTKDMSGKAEKAFSIIEQILEQNEKAIIFTQYKEMGDLLVKMLKDEFKMDVPFFHGSVTREKREEMVENFQTNDDIKLMIISLKAGGIGLNLTAATNVIHYDLWWNPAVEDQATDRTYRIGQTSNVIVHRLITIGTFEEKIDEMIKSKKELADLTVSTGEKQITELSNQELREIFSLTKV